MIDHTTPTVEVRGNQLKKYFKGKTIKAMDRALNCISFEFSDGSEILLESETVDGCPAIVGYICKVVENPPKANGVQAVESCYMDESDGPE